MTRTHSAVRQLLFYNRRYDQEDQISLELILCEDLRVVPKSLGAMQKPT